MGYAGRTIVAATFVLLNATHGQESDGNQPDPVSRDADMFVTCLMLSASRCIEDMSDRRVLADLNMRPQEVVSQTRPAPLDENTRYESHSFALAPPWGPFDSVDRLGRIVPYYETAIDGAKGQRWERVGYLIAGSYDGGQSWQFVKIEAVNSVVADWMERQAPGVAEPRWPEVDWRIVQEPPLVRSRGLRTLEREFVMLGDGFAYAMEWEIRTEILDATDISVRYEDPADRSRLLRFSGSLQAGQRSLEWQSPVLTGFESGQVYHVVVEVSDPDTDEILFEHRQPLIFRPALELWKAAMATPPASNSAEAP